MGADRPAHLLVHVGLDHLRAPIAVVAADEADDRDVVKEAGQHDLLAVPVLERERRALQQMVGRGEPAAEIVDEGGLLRHFRKARVLAHEEELAGVLRLQRGATCHLDPAVGQIAQHRLGDDVLEFMHHALFELVCALRQRHQVGDFARCRLRSHLTLPCLSADWPVHWSLHGIRLGNTGMCRGRPE